MKKKQITLATLFAIVATCAFGRQVAQIQEEPSAGSSTSNSGPFDKIWSVAASQFNQSNQWAGSLTQLTNGTLVGAGGDGGNQPNSCKGFLGAHGLLPSRQTVVASSRSCIPTAQPPSNGLHSSGQRRMEDSFFPAKTIPLPYVSPVPGSPN